MRDNLHVRMTAEEYDSYTAQAVDPWDKLIIGRLTSARAGRGPGGRLLDIGTGTAVVLVKLCALDQFRDVELIGTDYYEDMVVAARHRVEQAGLQGRIRLDCEDVHALTYPDGFARYVISKSTIHHWADPVKAFQEIYRVLEPGGVAIIHEIRRDADPQIIEHFNQLRRAAGVGPTNLEEKYTPDEVRQMCAQAGLAEATRVYAASGGPGAIGFEVRISRPA